MPDNATLFYLLATKSHRSASDSRDKIYSLLSLLPKDLYDFVEVGYSLSQEEAIVWASRIFIELDREKGCLCDAGLANRVDDSLTSWVIDWRDRSVYEHTERREIPGHIRSDDEFLCARFQIGRQLDPRNRRLKIPGYGFGRLKISRGTADGSCWGSPEHAGLHARPSSHDMYRANVCSCRVGDFLSRRLEPHNWHNTLAPSTLLSESATQALDIRIPDVLPLWEVLADAMIL